MSAEMQRDRKAAEHEYTISAFDYASAPVGSRDWTLFWKGWQAARRSQGQEWISVEERLPNCTIECTTSWTDVSVTVHVFGTCAAGYVGQGFGHLQDDGKWVCYEGEYDFMHITEVTHWKPLSSPPLPAAPSGEVKE